MSNSKLQKTTKVYGDISDNKLCTVVEVKPRTLTNWKTTKPNLYWMLKSLSLDEMEELIAKGMKYKEAYESQEEDSVNT